MLAMAPYKHAGTWWVSATHAHTHTCTPRGLGTGSVRCTTAGRIEERFGRRGRDHEPKVPLLRQVYFKSMMEELWESQNQW